MIFRNACAAFLLLLAVAPVASAQYYYNGCKSYCYPRYSTPVYKAPVVTPKETVIEKSTTVNNTYQQEPPVLFTFINQSPSLHSLSPLGGTQYGYTSPQSAYNPLAFGSPYNNSSVATAYPSVGDGIQFTPDKLLAIAERKVETVSALTGSFEKTLTTALAARAEKARTDAEIQKLAINANLLQRILDTQDRESNLGASRPGVVPSTDNIQNFQGNLGHDGGTRTQLFSYNPVTGEVDFYDTDQMESLQATGKLGAGNPFIPDSLIEQTCLNCHSEANKAKGGGIAFDLDNLDALTWLKMQNQVLTGNMPKGRDKLNDEELRAFLEEGAKLVQMQ